MLENCIVVPIRYRPIKYHEKIGDNTVRMLTKLGNGLWNNSPNFEFEITTPIPFYKPGGITQHDFHNPVKDEITKYSPVEQIIFDFGGPNETGPLALRLGLAFDSLLSSILGQNPNLKILVTLPFKPDKNDEIAHTLNHRCDTLSNFSMYFYDTNELVTKGLSKNKRNTLENQVKLLAELAKEKMPDRLARKLVCHLGYYSKDDSECPIYDFYDGSSVSTEVFSCLNSLIKKELHEGKPLRVAYDAMSSDWFTAAIEQLAANSEGKFSVIPIKELVSNSSDCSADILLYPVTRTGKTARNTLKKIKNLGVFKAPKIWTVLYANAETNLNTYNVHDLQFDDDNGPTQIHVHSIIQTADRGGFLKSLWADLTIAPKKVEEINLSNPFTSDSMWAMIFESGIIEEKNVPDRRDPIEMVPDFDRILDNNATLFAAKIHNIEEEYLASKLGRNTYYLIPDEPVPHKLCESLWGIKERPTIAVNNHIYTTAIDRNSFITFKAALDKKMNSLKTLDNDFEDNWKEVERFKSEPEIDRKNRSPGRQVIILTEFSYSGATIAGLRRFAQLMGWEVLASITLANLKSDGLVAPDHSFYELINE